ncbi:unnamed protein product [Parnassius apollo]|uniref:(apollo) hypothetical protein n=1 Tax=Parnassius apollo TaxID=110799 RepID=A0A8S3XIP7_PARAO|nr:unnamed protein product [Parnassius apollo]
MPKHVFPRLLKQTLDNIENMGKNLKSEFEAAGIYAINEKRVLDRLPTQEYPEIHNNASQQCLETFKMYIEDMRTKECSTAPKKKRWQLFQIVDDESTSCSDLEEWREAVLNTANSSSDDNNEIDTVFFDDVHDMFPDDDERSASPRTTNIPHNENQENEDPLNVDQSVYTDEQFKVSVPSDGGAGCSKDIDTEIVNNSEISPDSFVVVELLYNENTKKQTEKKFIAQVTNMVSDGKVTCRFMRCFSATKAPEEAIAESDDDDRENDLPIIPPDSCIVTDEMEESDEDRVVIRCHEMCSKILKLWYAMKVLFHPTMILEKKNHWP